jgi:integrase/recombinase XerD
LNCDEEQRFLEALSRWPVIRDIALFQFHTGARVGEAAAMECRNVDYPRGEVRIAQHLHWERHKGGKTHLVPGTKTGPTRNVPLTFECKEMLRRRQAATSSSILFADTDGQWLLYRAIQDIYDRAFRKAGLPHRGTHVLRHTFTVRFLDQTKDIYALQKLLGHTDLKVTQVYAKYSNEAVRRSFQLFRGGMSVLPER